MADGLRTASQRLGGQGKIFARPFTARSCAIFAIDLLGDGHDWPQYKALA
jgi:hypothetical protein